VGEDGHGRQIRKMRRPRLRGAAGELKLRRPREDVLLKLQARAPILWRIGVPLLPPSAVGAGN
jgi:hypothetical protein